MKGGREMEPLPYVFPDPAPEADALRIELDADADFGARHADALHDGDEPWPAKLRDVGVTP